MKKISVILIIVLILSGLSGCLRQKGQQTTTKAEPVTLTVYGLFDSEDIYTPLIESFESQYKNVSVVYKKFNDPETYLDLIVNELAEGEGPDIFLMHNSWFPKHYKKLTPAPDTIVTPDVFRSLFVDVTADDLIIPDKDGLEQVWGLPLYVDTLALYYNDDHIEDAIPSRGEPGDTWEEIQEDVTLLNREDQSFERFERAGIALGRSDNILRAFDILMSMLTQYKVDFYNDSLTDVTIGSDPGALAALEMYTSFALPSKKNYSWNRYLSDEDSGEKELTTFASGKVSMIMGFSYTYGDIINEINRLSLKGEDTISVNDIKLKESPQAFDPNTSAETREAFASYFVPVVSRTTDHSEEAWAFLATLVDEDNLRYFNEETHRPSALRSLIDEQSQDPIYGVFASQVGYATSIPMADPEAYEAIFLNGIDKILDTAKTTDVLKSIEDQLQELIPSTGIKPIYVPIE